MAPVSVTFSDLQPNFKVIQCQITRKWHKIANYGRPLSVSGRPCYILPMFIYFYGRLIVRLWLTEVRESFTRGGGP